MNYPRDGTPAHPNTPNLDSFIRSGVLFDNFYTTPMCAQSRAALLTGRSYPKTGTMLVSGGTQATAVTAVSMQAVQQPTAAAQQLQCSRATVAAGNLLASICKHLMVMGKQHVAEQ
jgi:arylsulfatase A-like enzyme